MPEYDFYCQDCRRRFTALMSISEHDKAKAPCPKCGKTRAVQKQLSDVSVVTRRKSV